MNWESRRIVLAIAACGLLSSACGPVSVASYPGQTSFPPPVIQPLDLRLGVIPFGKDANGAERTEIPARMRALGLFKSVDAVNSVPDSNFDLVLDLRGMGLTNDRVADVDASGTGKRLYTWKPDCGWTDRWCVNPQNLARDVAWLFAAGTALQKQLDDEMKKAAAQRKQDDASTGETSPEEAPAAAPANADKPWWESGAKR